MSDIPEANRLARATLRDLQRIPTSPLSGCVEQLARGLVLVTEPEKPKARAESDAITVDCHTTPVAVYRVAATVSCMCSPGASPHAASYVVAGRPVCARSLAAAVDHAYLEAVRRG